MIDPILKKILSKLSHEELLDVQDYITSFLKEQRNGDDHRGGDRIKAPIVGSCMIIREREFFHKEYKIYISDISSQGVKFRSTATIIKGDFLQIFFRSPLKGNMKDSYVEVLRARQVEVKGKKFVEVGAKSVDYQEVQEYFKALAKGIASKRC